MRAAGAWLPESAALVDLVLFLAGAALLGSLVRWWRPDLTRRAVHGHLALVLAFYGAALATPALQVATDIPYLWRPWSETVAPGFRPANPLLSDVPLQMVPFRALVRERLLRLEAPLWAHELGTGQPLLGNGQSAPFAPLHLLALPLPAPRALTVSVAWQTLLGLLLMHALLRALGAGGVGAAFAAVAYAFSSFAVSWAYHPHAMAAAWIPGVFLGMVLLARGERGGFVGLVACAVGLATSGHPETLAHAAVAASAVAAALVARAAPADRRRVAARLAAATLLAAGLSAPVLGPLLEALPHGQRRAAVEARPGGVDPPPFAARHLLPVVAPLAFGSPRDGSWRGPVNFNEMCTSYAGLLALALALAGAVALRGRVLAILAAGAVALAGAVNLPPFLDLWRAPPLLEHAAHARLRLLWVLAVAVAAGLSLEVLARTRAALLMTGAAVAAAGLATFLVPPPGGVWQSVWHAAALGGAMLVLLALAFPRLRPWFPRLALAALTLELGLLGWRYHPLLPPGLALDPPPALAALVAAAATGPPGRVLAFDSDLGPNLASLAGLWDARGNDPMQPARATAVVGTRLDRRSFIGRPIRFRRRTFDQPLVDYLAVRWILAHRRTRLPPPWEREPAAVGGRLWHNPGALDLFFVPERVERVPSPEAALAHAVANPDFRRLAALLDTEERSLPAGEQDGRIERVAPRSNGFEIEVTTAAGGVVASSVSSLPGWRARSGRRSLPVVEVNGGFLGLVVGPGRTVARLDYRPRGWTWGLALAGASLGACLVALVARLTRRAAPRPVDGAGRRG